MLKASNAYQVSPKTALDKHSFKPYHQLDVFALAVKVQRFVIRWVFPLRTLRLTENGMTLRSFGIT